MGKLDLSLTEDEIDEFLGERKTVRVATVGRDGAPHVVPLWFVWHDGTMFLNSTKGNLTVENAMRTGTVSAVVDDGETYDVLRAVVLSGPLEEAEEDPRLPAAERLWSDKYMGGGELPYRKWRGRVWLRLVPRKVSSWDFRKMNEARARRDAKGVRG